VSAPLTVSIPHRLGREEALRRLKKGLDRVNTDFGSFIAVDEATWSGDRVAFRVRALGQASSGTIEVFESHLQLEVTLPWLLAKLADRFVPAIRKEATLLLEKK
jgi:hypothetical protein